MIKANQDVREKAMKNGVYLWQIAERLNITDTHFSRKMRKELSDEEKNHIFSIIDEIGKGQK